MNSDLPPNKQTHVMEFLNGPLQGEQFILTGVLPSAQVHIGGTMEIPVFHFYVMDANQNYSSEKATMVYRFQKTYSFEEFATKFPVGQPDPPTKF